MWNPSLMVAMLILERSATTHTKIVFMIAEIYENAAAFMMHGSTLTKIENINQIFQFTIKKAADLALEQVHCYSSTYNISLHDVIFLSPYPQNKFNYNTILKNFIRTCSYFKPAKKRKSFCIQQKGYRTCHTKEGMN